MPRERDDQTLIDPEKFRREVGYTTEKDIILVHDGAKYEVAFDRCDSPAKLLDWIGHLCGKAWVTTRHIRFLVAEAAERNGIEIARDA